MLLGHWSSRILAIAIGSAGPFRAFPRPGRRGEAARWLTDCSTHQQQAPCQPRKWRDDAVEHTIGRADGVVGEHNVLGEDSEKRSVPFAPTPSLPRWAGEGIGALREYGGSPLPRPAGEG
ncbi:hypothetical protein [Azospirillum doebereinerae]